jgi:thiol-disulfide isomerase/thioredoxin
MMPLCVRHDLERRAACAGLLAVLVAAAAAPGHLAAAAAAKSAAKPAPAAVITLATLKTNMEKLRGRVVVLHLWATWCLPCLDELPLMAKFARDMRPRGVEIVSASLDEPGAARAVRTQRDAAPRRAGCAGRSRRARLWQPRRQIPTTGPWPRGY